MKIGVFDSGVGGLAIANAIHHEYPEHEILLREDREHVPYGTRTPGEIFGFVVPILQKLQEVGCSVIVIACNTVSTTLIGPLRKRFPEVQLVAIEPMVKPAAELTKSGTIAVCATQATLNSERYTWLKQIYATGIKVLEPDCSDWAYMIEHNQIDDKKIVFRINEVLDGGADVIVLGCTHYHWIEEKIVMMAKGRAEVLQPEQAIIRQLGTVLARLK